MRLKVIEKEDQPWYADGLNFTCSQCGNCCTGGPGYVWLSEVEIGRLAEHLHLGRDEVIERYCRKLGGRYSLKENCNAQGAYDCVFLREEKIAGPAGQPEHTRRTCLIYTVRPLQCRTWPFWEGNLQSQENWKRASRRCPGMNGGRRYSPEQIEALRDATDWPANPPTSASVQRGGSKEPTE